MALKTLLIDNEKHCLDRLKILLEHYCSETVNIVGQCQTVEESLAAIETLKPELVFLDVRLDNDVTCFSLLSGVNLIDFDIIFVTAHDEYALRAFQVDAVDYLLKPVDADKLVKAVGKVLGRSSGDRNNYQLQLSKAVGKPAHIVGRISVPSHLPNHNGRLFIDIKDIVYCQSDGGYTNFFGVLKDNNKKNDRNLLGMILSPISDLEEELNNSNFCRIHDSFLINLAYLKTYVNGRGGYVEMTDGTAIDVSAKRKTEFKRRTQNGIF